MKKNYTSAILIFVLGLCCSFASFAQITANDDLYNNVNGTSGNPNQWFTPVFDNDNLNGLPANLSNVTFTQLSTTNTGINVQQGFVSIAPGIPAGTYYVLYQICSIANPGICDVATVTVNICAVDAPVIAEPTCTSSYDSLLIQNLPPTGTWTLNYTRNFNNNPISITGTGTSFLLDNLQSGYYTFTVTNSTGCISAPTSVSLGYLQGLEAETTGTYVDQNSDGIVNVGDIISYQMAITNLLDCEMTNVNISDTNLIISGSPIATLAPGATDNSMTGIYVLTQADVNNGSVYNWSGVSATSNGFSLYIKTGVGVELAISDGISLNAFYDLNNNGTQDSGEESANEGYFHVELNNNVIHDMYTNAGNVLIYETNPLNMYDLSYTISPYGCSGEYTSNVVFNNITVAAGSGITVYNFPIVSAPCQDLAVYIFGSGPRPGLAYYNYVSFINYGNQAIAAGTLTFTKDNRVTISSVSEPDAVLNPTGFTYNFTNLQPNEARYLMVSMDVPAMPTVNLGDLLTNSVAITPDDSFPANNSHSVTQIVTNSYDPNDISERHGGKVLHSSFTAADYLTYTIRFENTGNANAFDVMIENNLDTQLDESTVRIVTSSHNCILDRSGSALQWKFQNINLPPSVTGTPVGKGYVVYQIKPKAGYAVGDIIPNTASIYFDSNPAIVTNTNETEFVSVLGVDGFAATDFAVYPNPTKNVVNISLKNHNIETIAVADVLGKTVLSETVNSKEAKVDLSQLSKGLYFVKATAGKQQQTFKIIKE